VTRVPRLLITNDDGIDSIGLHILARAMSAHGEVVVAAPDGEYSGAGAALGALHVIHPEVRQAALDGLADAWAVTGPPGLCVMFARLGVFGPIDLVVSGINPGANVGRAIYHSGTVGAAITARNGGCSGVAVSQAVAGFGVEGQGWDEMIADQHWDTAAHVASAVVGAVLAARPAEPVVANVNVPNLPLDQIKGWRHTTVGLLPTRTVATGRLEPIGGRENVYAVRMEWGDELELPADTDGGAIERDEVTVSYLSRLVAEARPDLGLVDTALDGLLSGHPSTLRP
jgi:5'/3'-nucleotidase